MTIRLTGLVPVLALLAASAAHAQGTPPGSANDATMGGNGMMTPAQDGSGAAAAPGTGNMMRMRTRHHAMPAATPPAGGAATGDAATPAGQAAAQALSTAPSDAPVPYVDFPPQAASPKGAMHHAVMRRHMAAKKAAATPAQ